MLDPSDFFPLDFQTGLYSKVPLELYALFPLCLVLKPETTYPLEQDS